MPYILYLEPTGILKQYCLDYFQSTQNFINEAHQYPPHISVTGFFETTEIIIQQVIDQVDKFVDGLRKPTFQSPLKTTKSIIIPAIFKGEQFGILKQLVPEIRIKNMDHISLAYLNHGIESTDFSEEELVELLEVASSAWRLFPNQGWELAVYNVVKSTDLVNRHQFKELKRWTIK